MQPKSSVKAMIEPEMTCLNEEDAKNEAFSTRIGRSFTFQKRSDDHDRRNRAVPRGNTGPPPFGGSRGRSVYRKDRSSGQTRPAAMHVDDYQAAEEDEDSHKRSYSPDQYDSSNHSPRYRSPNYGDHRSPGSYDKPDRRDRSQSPFNDRPNRSYRPRGISSAYRGSNPIRGYRGSPRGRGAPPYRGRGGAPPRHQSHRY